jgi:cytochrome c biogenesis protein CcdA
MSILFSIIYAVFSFVTVFSIIAIAATHLYAKFKRSRSLVLSSDSIILIVGGCTGIGKLMAIKLAK